MDDISELRERWVAPLYLELLHGNFRGELLAEEVSADRDQAIKRYRRCVRGVTPEVVEVLLNQSEWRARLVGSWYAGLRGWTRFRDDIGMMLLESEMCYACQGYCAALACFADETSSEHLRRYLDKWLPQLDKYYDQHWALPALVWADGRIDAHHADDYLVPGGLWERWASARHQQAPQFYFESQRSFDLTLASALAAFR